MMQRAQLESQRISDRNSRKIEGEKLVFIPPLELSFSGEVVAPCSTVIAAT